ncbi:MAG: 23S rRNA (guanosine(2251)-2'-O)-methyltransferase RlmB [Fibrobacter sp.]|nr:23S rRNA (guanosine(2251)-2'-O)-methyltransferase RlmB [Fibrobacter sp.]
MQQENFIYGIHAVEELLQTRLQSVDHVYFDKDKRNPALFNLIKFCRKERLSYNLVPELRIQQLTGTTKHQGVAALCSAKPYCSVDEIQKMLSTRPNPLVILPASVEDPGNLGSIIRSSVAFGVDALLLERKNSAPLNAAVAKSSAGMLEHLCIGRPKNLEALVQDFRSKNYAVIGAEMENGKKPEEIDFSGPVVLVLGGEHRGIPPYLNKLCTGFVSIPMTEKTQSLNVSASASVLLYEISRQRKWPFKS